FSALWWPAHATRIDPKLRMYAASDGHTVLRAGQSAPGRAESSTSGTRISRTSSVQAIAKTPSLNASIPCSSLCEFIRLDAYSEVSKTRRAHKYRRGPIEIGEELLQRFDLWEIVDHDVRVSRILLKKVLVVVLGSEEGTVRLDFRDDWSPEHL